MKSHIFNHGKTSIINHIMVFPGSDYLFIQVATKEKHPYVVIHKNNNDLIIQFYANDYEIGAHPIPDMTRLTLTANYIQEIKIFSSPLFIHESNRGGVDIWIRDNALKSYPEAYEVEINEPY